MLTSAPSRRASLRQLIGVGVRVVHAPDHDVLERHPLPKRPCRANHRVEIVLLLDRHDRAPLGRRRGVKGDGQPELFRAPGERLHAGHNSDGGDRDVAGADAEARRVVEQREGDVHRGPVQKRLAHPHEDHIRGRLGWVTQYDFPDLAGDLEGGQVAAKPHPAGGAKRAAKRAPRLGRDAEGAAGAGRDEDRLDRLAVGQAPEVLAGAVDRLLNDLGRQSRKGQSIRQARPEGPSVAPSRPPTAPPGPARVVARAGRPGSGAGCARLSRPGVVSGTLPGPHRGSRLGRGSKWGWLQTFEQR